MIYAEIITGLTVIGFVYGFLRNFRSDLISHIDSLEKRMEVQSVRSDALSKKTDEIFLSQSQRSDRLYEMFIDLLKSKNT